MLRRLFSLHPIARLSVLAVLAACGETGPSEQLPAAAVTDVTGIALQGPAGDVLAERVVVRVVDASQNPLPGVAVTFSVSAAGASVSPANTVTNDQGEATTRWTLGRTPGQQVLSVSAGGATLQVTATAGAPRIAALAVNSGNGQTGVVGTALGTSPTVIARDASGNPVEGVTVFFSVISGGGSVVNATAVTNASGVASAGIWTLGSSTGTQLLSAQVPQNGVTNNPIVFSAIATAGAPASVVPISATQQTAQVGSLVSSAPSVVVRDAAGNAAANVSVSFAVTAGAGQVTNAGQTTNAQGVATVGSWRMGSSPGTNTVTATVAGVAPVSFNATATAGSPTQIVKFAGDNQTSAVNRPVPIAPTVRVLDGSGNGVSGVTVTFTVGSGDGSAVVGSVVSNSDGRASVGAWILGPTPGPNTLIANVVGLGSVVFDAVATGGAAASMQPISQVTQSGIAGQVASSPPAVVVRDASGNPVQGVTVTFIVTGGGGSLIGASIVTDVTGTATVAGWTLGSTAGLNTVIATSTGLPSVTFTATTTGLPSQMVIFNGNNQSAVQGTAVPIPPTVRVTDNNGQGAAGVSITFQVTSGGGNVTGALVVTDATGVASVGSWTLGSGASNTVTATPSTPGIIGAPALFTAISATHIGITQQPPANGTLGGNITVTVQLRNGSTGGTAAPANGVPLSISIASGGGTIAGTTGAVTSGGLATFTFNVTGAAGARTFNITGPGLVTNTTTSITLN